MLTPEQYAEIKSRYDTRHALVVDYCKAHHTSGIPAEVYKDWPTVTNDETSALEVYQFVTDPPDRYFAYVNHDEGDPGYGKPCTITTWTGEPIAQGKFTSRLYINSMGDKRITFTAKGINGKVYNGTFYYSAGDYCRMKQSVAH